MKKKKILLIYDIIMLIIVLGIFSLTFILGNIIFFLISAFICFLGFIPVRETFKDQLKKLKNGSI